MAEPTEGTEGMTGADDGLSVNETVDALADSLHLGDGGELEAGKEPAGSEHEAPIQDDQTGAPPPVASEKEGAAPAPAAAPASAPSERVPDTWRSEAKEKWATVDPVVRAEIAKREGDVAKFVAEAKPSFEIARAVTQVCAPYMPILQKYGVDPIQHIGALLNSHTTLMFGAPEVKAQLFRNLAHQAGVDLAALVADPRSTGQANDQQLGYIRALEERLTRMEGGVTSVTSTIQEAREAELTQGIMAFASDTEKHPFFWEVAETGEIKALIDTGAARTLNDAYELAVLKNPVTRAKQLALESKHAAEAAARTNAVKTQAARRATGANVRSRNSGRIPPGEESIDETLRTTLSDIHSRH